MPTTTSVDTVNLTIDGQPVSVPKGTLVIEAARRVGVMIPHFCYHPKLKPDANCRMCLVEVEKMPKLQTACSTPVSEGMAVRTATTVVNNAHKSVLEFILANHPLDCPVCDQGGRCDLQDFSHEYTPTTSRFIEIKRVFQKEYFSPLIETQMNRCVQCLRCVRYCDEVMDVKALAPVGRGTMTEIKSFTTHELDCEFCGGCVQICPVGAITSRLSMYEYRPWMLKRADTICTYCGDGCQITLQTKNNQLIEANSAYGAGRNNGDLCARGFFGYHVSTAPERLTQPLIRRDGKLVPATWEEALEYIAETAVRLKLAHGPNAFAGLIGARCTNEDLYLFQKFLRLAVGTNKIDSSPRYGTINAARALARVLGTIRWTVSFDDIVAADTLLLIGTNITETNPVTGLRVKEAVKKRGATLLTVDTLQPAIGKISNITNLSSQHLVATPDRFHAVVLALIKAVLEQSGPDSAAAKLATQAPSYHRVIGERTAALAWPTLETATGSTAQDLQAMASALLHGSKTVILLGQSALRHPNGFATAMNLLDLLLLLGRYDQPGCGLAPLTEENNEQGALELGVMPEFLPGGADPRDKAARERLAKQWGEEVPTGDGASLMQMLDQARNRTLKAMFVVGENPVGSLPPDTKAREAFASLDLLVCHELFMTETAALAHVVLPACSYAEKDGTFTNTEGHVQRVRQAIAAVGDSRPDWEILSALSNLMGTPLEYGDAQEILKEIRAVIPGYSQLGPAPVPNKPVAAAVNQYLSEEFSSDLAARYTLPATLSPTGKTSLLLCLEQSLFHSGKLSTHAKGLQRAQASGALALNPADAESRGLAEGDCVRLSNERGSASTTVVLLDRIPVGTARFPDHFDTDLKVLFTCVTDPRTGVPTSRQTWVQVEKETRRD
ncbi:MAG: NADH-quinone oxidoreductase subunit NuoG [Nitrospiraceae bacterium]